MSLCHNTKARIHKQTNIKENKITLNETFMVDDGFRSFFFANFYGFESILCAFVFLFHMLFYVCRLRLRLNQKTNCFSALACNTSFSFCLCGIQQKKIYNITAVQINAIHIQIVCYAYTCACA